MYDHSFVNPFILIFSLEKKICITSMDFARERLTCFVIQKIVFCIFPMLYASRLTATPTESLTRHTIFSLTVPSQRVTAWPIEKVRRKMSFQRVQPVMGFRGFAQVRANPFLECRDNQRTRSCFLL